MSEEEDMELLENSVAKLTEHFDAVHIFATRQQDGDTAACSYGDGNYYARWAMIQEWLMRQRCRLNIQARRAIEEEEDDDDT